MGKVFFNGVTHPIKHKPFKRAFDIIFSLIALAATAPFILSIALIIKISTQGRVFYSHRRIGRGGKQFKCYKFRTMHPDADKKLNKILASCPNMRSEWEQCQKLKNDPRITKVGAFLRKTSLDELPQFWNVLKGDLSVVGPRPVVHSELTQHFGLKAAKILSIRPGITGIWQVSGRSDLNYSNRVMLDEKYVDSSNFLLDMKLIVKTIPSILGNKKGAY